MKELKQLSVIDIGAKTELTVDARKLWSSHKETEECLAFYRQRFLRGEGTSRLAPEIKWVLSYCARGTFCIRLSRREEAVAEAVFHLSESHAENAWAVVENVYLRNAGLLGAFSRPPAPWMLTGILETGRSAYDSDGARVLRILLEIGWSCWNCMENNWKVVEPSELTKLNAEHRKDQRRMETLLSRNEEAQSALKNLRETIRGLELEKTELLRQVTASSDTTKETRIHDLEIQVQEAEQQKAAIQADSELSFKKRTEIERQLEDYRRATTYHQNLLRKAGIPFNTVIGHGEDHHHNEAA